jgi:hypothetical protein
LKIHVVSGGGRIFARSDLGITPVSHIFAALQQFFIHNHILTYMYLVAIAWIYVALMMAVAEATHSTGTVLGAIVTFVVYGLIPMSIVMYLLGAPSRNKARKDRERAEWVAQQNAFAKAGTGAVVGEGATMQSEGQQTTDSVRQPDASSHAPGATQAGSIAPVREKQ